MILFSEPTSPAHPHLSTVPEMLDVLPEIRLATTACVHDAIPSRRGTRYDPESHWLDEGAASGSATADEAALRVAHRGTLQRAVVEYTRQMRTLGHYPEQVLVAVKSTVRDVATPEIDKRVLDTLVGDAAQWAIAAYFDTRSDT